MKKAFAYRMRACIALFLVFLVFLLTSCSERYPREYEDIVQTCSLDYGVPEAYIFAVIYVESHFQPTAVSSSDARGLMQLRPDTYLDMCERLGLEQNIGNIFVPEFNIRCGTYYLAYLYDLFGDWDTALAAYNAGLGNVAKWLKDERYSDGHGHLTSIPFPETARYLEKIHKAIKGYERGPSLVDKIL